MESSKPQSQPTQDVGKDQWSTFLAEFTRENRGAHARLEVLGPEVGHQVPADDRPFDEISADMKDGEQTVWITLGLLRKPLYAWYSQCDRNPRTTASWRVRTSTGNQRAGQNGDTARIEPAGSLCTSSSGR